MKKCPTCNKSYADHLRFCQADGSQLVDLVEEAAGGQSSIPTPSGDPFSTAEPAASDPLRTTVANPTSSGAIPPPPGTGGLGPGAPAKPESPIASSNEPSPAKDFGETIFSGSIGGFGSESGSQEPPTMVVPSGITFGAPADTPRSTMESNFPAVESPPAPWGGQGIGTAGPLPGAEPNKTLAIVSLVCGILSLTCCGIITGIAAIVTGFIARKKATEDPANFAGSGLAMAGIIMGAISILLTILFVILQVFVGVMGQVVR